MKDNFQRKNTVKMRPKIPACESSSLFPLWVVGLKTIALVTSVGPWYLFLGGTE